MKKPNVKTVVVGVDFSNYSKQVVRQAQKISRATGAPLVVAHVFQDLSYLERRFYNDIKGEVLEHLKERVVQKFNLSKKGTTAVVEFGNPAEKLVQISRRFSQPLIVVGHRGLSRMSRFLLGSTAERLALTSPFPVYIHRGTHTGFPRKFLVPCDLSQASKHCIRWLDDFADHKDLKAELFYVNVPAFPTLDFESWAKMEQALEKKRRKETENFSKQFRHFPFNKGSGDPVDEIVRRSKFFDVITISPHDRPKLFPSLGSVTAKVLRQSATPLLVVPSRG